MYNLHENCQEVKSVRTTEQNIYLKIIVEVNDFAEFAAAVLVLRLLG